ncbi:MAG: hypothetical protein IJY83_03615 [Oscillospiraceae bacterium]|nr:hypothetical protein [Oscillospiraceae bacterium]
MFKKITAFLLIATMCFILSGCSNNGTSVSEGAETGNPEEIVKGYYTCLINEKYDIAYDKYVSSISKVFETKEEFSQRMELSAFMQDKKLKDVLINDAELVMGTEDVIYKIKGIAKYELDGETITEDFFEYVITQKQTGFNRILIDGALSAKPYEMANGKGLHASKVMVYNTVEGKRVKMTMTNNDVIFHAIGKETMPPMLEIVVGGRTRPCKFPSYTIIEPGKTAEFTAEYDGVSGEVTKVVLSSIYAVGENKKPSEEDSGRVYSLTLEK